MSIVVSPDAPSPVITKREHRKCQNHSIINAADILLLLKKRHDHCNRAKIVKRKPEYKNKPEVLLFVLRTEHLVKVAQKKGQFILYIFLELQGAQCIRLRQETMSQIWDDYKLE